MTKWGFKKMYSEEHDMPYMREKMKDIWCLAIDVHAHIQITEKKVIALMDLIMPI